MDDSPQPATETTNGAANGCRKDFTQKGERAESGLMKTKDHKLTQRAIANGWIPSQRWPTREPVIDIERRVESQGIDHATIVDRVALQTAKDIESPDHKTRRAAGRTALAMEAQNQTDDHHAQGQLVNHVVETIEQRNARLAALDAAIGIGSCVDALPAGDAVGHLETIDGAPHINGESNGKPV